MYVFYLEGNIGSGKSTFIQFLQDYINKNKLNAEVLLEPVEDWQNTQDKDGVSILHHYYQDQKKMAFPFQMNAFISRVDEIVEKIKTSKTKILFVERSVLTDKNVFLQLNYDLGNISDIEYTIYNKWFDTLCKHFDIKHNGIVYIKTDYNICHQRIKKRDRSGEETIPIDYLEKLEVYHDNWILENWNNLITINSNENFYENTDLLTKEIKKIFSFIDKMDEERVKFY